jgi:hypothetical protein
MTPRTRAGRDPLNRERVLRAAMGVADAEGLDAVTMRRVGHALGVEWKGAIRRCAWSGRAVVRRHPWAPALLASRRRVRLPMVTYLDGVTGCLLAAGFSPQLSHTAVHVLASRVLAFARDLFDPGEQGAPDPAILEALSTGTLPHARRVMDEADHDDDAEFAFGLDLILDGLERRLANG